MCYFDASLEFEVYSLCVILMLAWNLIYILLCYFDSSLEFNLYSLCVILILVWSLIYILCVILMLAWNLTYILCVVSRCLIQLSLKSDENSQLRFMKK